MTPFEAAMLQPGFLAVLRFGAVLLLACEGLILWSRRSRQPGSAVRLVWAVMPAAVFVGLCFWCAATQPAGLAGDPVTQVAAVP